MICMKERQRSTSVVAWQSLRCGPSLTALVRRLYGMVTAMDRNGFTSPPSQPAILPQGLDSRSAAVLREIVEQYVETGEPVGSRTLSRRLPLALSPATIRNVMADLTEAGLLYAPHTSAGRLPTDRGLRLFVDGLLQFGDLADEEREAIDAALSSHGRSLQDTLAEASTMLSGLSAAAGLVLAPRAP
jgi:heat-inducible transcriptional repressor